MILMQIFEKEKEDPLKVVLCPDVMSVRIFLKR